jgi:hypothetical protein
MSIPDPAASEQQEALSALENHEGEWGTLARNLDKARTGAIAPLSSGAIARLEAIRMQTLAAHAQPPAPGFFRRHSTTLLSLAAAVALIAGLGWFFVPHRSPNAGISVWFPRGDTPTPQPSIQWAALPGKSYDVWILPPEGDVLTVKALYKAEKVRPPVDFAALKPAKDSRSTTGLEPGADYRLLVCYADTQRVGGVAVPFHVRPAPRGP